MKRDNLVYGTVAMSMVAAGATAYANRDELSGLKDKVMG